jgi:hypothetical protein
VAVFGPTDSDVINDEIAAKAAAEYGDEMWKFPEEFSGSGLRNQKIGNNKTSFK